MFNDKEGFVCYILGKRNSGKTTLLSKMLINDTLLCNKFDEIYIISPTFKYQKLLHKYEFTHIINEYDNEYLLNLMKDFENIESEEKITRLFIFDDCLAEEDFKSNDTGRNAINYMALNGRHLGISLVVLSQKYKGLSTDFRKQIDYLIVFKIYNNDEKKAIYTEYGRQNYKEFTELLNNSFTDKYDFIVFDNIKDRILKNFKYDNNLNNE
jgi:hypothetical protein